jgi:hypothetical protein
MKLIITDPNRLNKRVPKLLNFILTIIVIEVICAWGSATHQNIISDALELLRLKGPEKFYGEVFNYSNALFVGVNKEDDFPSDRSYNHYGPPDGPGLYCRKYLLNPDIVKLYKDRFSPPPAYFKDKNFFCAFDWAYNPLPKNEVLKFHNGDRPYTWKGAIEAYDYSRNSKDSAYNYLGHVIHLLSDMTETDHQKGLDHPGSSRTYKIFDSESFRDQLSKANWIEKYGILGSGSWFLKEVKSKGAHWPIYGTIVGALGFEKLVDSIEDCRKHNLSELKIVKWNSIGSEGKLKDFFINASVASWYHRARFKQPTDQPLGLDYITIPGQTKKFYFITRSGERIECIDVLEWNDVWLVPVIYSGYYESEKGYPNWREYINLAKECTKVAKEHSAGLLQLFHDIVRHPPYVHKVKIYQIANDDIRYESEYILNTGDKLTERTLNIRIENSLFQTCRETFVEITIGPFIEPSGQDFPGEATIVNADNLTVKIGVDGDYTKTIEMSLSDGNDGRKPPVFKGSFFPPDEWGNNIQKGCISIEAEDIYNHYYNAELASNRQTPEQSGKRLDSDPKTPAKVSDYNPPYPWRDYEFGIDKIHNNIGKFITSPPYVYKCWIYNPGAPEFRQYFADWSTDNCELPDYRTLTIRYGGMLLYNRNANVEIEVFPSTIVLDPSTVSVIIGISDDNEKPLSNVKIVGNKITGELQPELSWKSTEDAIKYAYVKIQAKDNKGREIDGKPASVAILVGIDEWNNYEKEVDKNHEGFIFTEEKNE